MPARNRVHTTVLACLACLGLGGQRAGAAEEAKSLPEGAGCAATCPGDRGIEKARPVVFAENFESGSLARWDDQDGNRPPEVILTTERSCVHGGTRAAQLAVPKGKSVGADLTRWFKPGYDRLFARWYCRFAENYDQGNLNHTGGSLVAARSRDFLGVAGVKPDGTDRFSTGLEPWRDWKRNPPPGELMFYTYYPDMKRDPSGPYYGNAFKPDKKLLLERARWYCLEIMVQANTPGQADGEQAFWVDGRLAGHFRGIRWRTTPALKVNCFWLTLYIHDSPQPNRVWVDDIVVATEYIGPMQP